MANRGATFFDKLFDAVDRLDYRIVYAVLAVVVGLPLAIGWTPPLGEPSEYVSGLYDTIEACAESGKPVLLINAWRVSSKGENQPQFEVIVDHMMRRNVKFVMLSLDLITADVGHTLCEHYAEIYGREYGVDWIDIGWRDIYGLTWGVWVDKIETEGFVGAFKNDIKNRELWKFPIMRWPEGEPGPGEDGAGSSTARASEESTAEGEASDEAEEVKGLKIADFGLFVEVSYVGTIRELIALVRLKQLKKGHDVRMAIATISMVTNQMLPYYDSHDLVAVLGGVKGASEYSVLLKGGPSSHIRGRMGAFAVAMLFVLFVIVLGNAGTLYKRLRKRET